MNYIVKYSGASKPDLVKLKKSILSINAKFIDETMLPKLAMVELESDKVKLLKDKLKGDWLIVPEVKYKLPDTRLKVKPKG